VPHIPRWGLSHRLPAAEFGASTILCQISIMTISVYMLADLYKNTFEEITL